MIDPNSWLGQIIIQVGVQSAYEGGKYLFAYMKNSKGAKTTEAELNNEAKQIAESIPHNEYISLSAKVDWTRVASLFWLGNDLMWIQNMMIRGASPKRVHEGIKGTMRYVRELGLSDETPAVKHLSECETILVSMFEISGTTEEEINHILQQYRAVYLKVQTVKWFIHGIASDKHSGFKKHRAGYSE
jgi:hypothetical protein